MQNLLRRTRSIRGLCCSVNSAPPRWWPPGLVRRDGPFMDLVCRLCNNRLPLAYATTKCMDTEKIETKCMDTEKIETKCMDIEEMKITKKVETEWFLDAPSYRRASHRDGAIYRSYRIKKEWPEIDITNRNETLLEPMMFSEPTENCYYHAEECNYHSPADMLQVTSLTLVHTPVSNVSMQLYGYVAVRDERDWMLNYVFNHSRDDPIVVQQGSSIEMTGPKRGILMDPPMLIEYDLRIKNGGLEEDDMDLIDGAMDFFLRPTGTPVRYRIYGNCGMVDISLAFVERAVEATIELVISDAQRALSLSLGSLVNIASSYEEIQLFQGSIDQLSLRRFVVAVPMNTEMILKVKMDNNRAEHCISFKAKQHGCDRQSMKVELCSIAVKVTWSSIWDG